MAPRLLKSKTLLQVKNNTTNNLVKCNKKFNLLSYNTNKSCNFSIAYILLMSEKDKRDI